MTRCPQCFFPAALPGTCNPTCRVDPAHATAYIVELLTENAELKRENARLLQFIKDTPAAVLT